MRNLVRAPILLVALFALVAAIWIGLVRIGWIIPQPAPGGLSIHGPLLISGFLGALIGLERAVAAQSRWAIAAPLAAGAGTIVLISGLSETAAQFLFVIASLVMLAALVTTLWRQPEGYAVVICAGAAAWLAGNAVWLAGGGISHAVPWWIGFLVLTVSGERLELSRMVRLTRSARVTFALSVAIMVGGIVASLVAYDAGVRVMGGGFLTLSLWLAVHDIARRTIRQSGLTRYIAACLLLGELWLGVSGGLFLAFGGVVAGAAYDAMLHALLLGCIFSLIFGHAPIIVPALFRVTLVYSPAFYLHLMLLHLSLALRLGGDLLSNPGLRQWGGLLNAIAILVFIINTVLAAVRGRVGARPR